VKREGIFYYIGINPLVDVIANRAPTLSARESRLVHSKPSLIAIRQTSAAPDVCYWQRELAHAGQSYCWPEALSQIGISGLATRFYLGNPLAQPHLVYSARISYIQLR
jgi:hypothetical protein